MKKDKQAHEPSEYKTVPYVPLEIEEDEGIVEHLVSVFGVLDLGRDICHPGSFTKTIAEGKGRIRVLDGHQRGSILNVIGVPLELKEVSRAELPAEVLKDYPEATGGLKARTQFLLDTPEGKGAFLRLKSGAVTEFSFAFDTLDADFTKDEKGRDVRNLRTIRLWEYGPVIFGMNPAAEVIDVKEAPVPDPEDMKPAPDVTKNTIRIRVKAPGGFQEGSFRTIRIGKKTEGIQAVIGKLKGETSTTIQSYIFDKEKWTAKTAKAWVKDHGDKKAISYPRSIDLVRKAFYRAYSSGTLDGVDYWIKEVFDEYLIVEATGEVIQTYFQIKYTITEDSVDFDPRGEWVKGEYMFVEREKPVVKDLATVIEVELAQIELELLGAGPTRVTHPVI